MHGLTWHFRVTFNNKTPNFSFRYRKIQSIIKNLHAGIQGVKLICYKAACQEIVNRKLCGLHHRKGDGSARNRAKKTPMRTSGFSYILHFLNHCFRGSFFLSSAGGAG
jgi:hypothetical protein